MANQKTLSICIPTWNRQDKLERILQCLHERIAGLESEVEICISDNGSTDNTGQVVAKWKKTLPITYGRNDHNTGFDFNMLSALKLAHGKYCWILGDDDTVLEGGFQKLLEDINSLGDKEVGAIYANILYPDGKKFNLLPDGPFEVYQFANGGYPPVTVLSMDCICMHQKTMAGIIRKKVYTRGDRVFKREADPDVLHLWIQAYLFLECAKKTGLLGIEPTPLARLIMDADPTMTYMRKMYYDLCSFNYAYDIMKNYPEFNEDFHYSGIKVRMVWYFLHVAMVCERPELEELHDISNVVFLKLLEMQGRRAETAVVRAVEAVRKLPLLSAAFPLAYRAFLFLRGRGNTLRNIEEKNPDILKSRDYMILHTERKFKIGRNSG